MAAAEEDKIGTITSMIDVDYEFSAPRFFDFTVGETEEEMREAELWFGTRCSYAPSPFMPRIKTSRSVQLDTVCDFSEDEQLEKASTLPESSTFNNAQEPTLKMEEQTMQKAEEVMKPEVKVDVPEEHEDPLTIPISSSVQVKAEVCTPTPPPAKSEGLLPLQQTNSKKQQTAKKIANLLRDPSALKSKYQPQQSQTKAIKTPSIRREAYKKITAETPNLAQENQAIKRQKLEGGKSRQILNVKPQILPHKNKAGLVSGCSNLCSLTTKTCKEDRKLYVRETAAPFVSMAELMRKFQSNTREMSLSSHVNNSKSHDEATGIQRKPKLTLTRPKEPEFETAQRVRSVKIRSSAELEEEMMAKIPKFKARPLNKKILETATLPTLSRKNIPLTEFKEFHLETMSRANHQNAETSKVVLVESSQSHQWKPNHITAPKSPVLQTSLRARPPTSVKSSDELEKEELEKIPKFKARPLNKRIFESKGDLGIFCNKKRQITVPQEFHFAIDERIPPPTNVADMFDKLSIRSETQREKPIPRNTTPQPFQLHTEERGMEKVRKWTNEVLQKEWEEECARIPKAHPYPYTTDYPVVPPKPEPKPCTKPEPFELESLMRHEEEVEREMEERRLKELGEAQMRVFKAQPILKEDPIPLPEKPRIPLTEVQEFNLQVQNRAVDRAEFDKKVKEKEMMYKRYREEAESAKLMEEEKALKQLRRTLVPHARPVPNFNRPFMPRKSSKHVTKPMSPRLNVEQIKERRKMSACPYAGQSSSSSATQMR